MLDARDLCPDALLAKLYGPINEARFSELAEVHNVLDKAVNQTYGWDFNGLSWDEKGDPYRLVAL